MMAIETHLPILQVVIPLLMAPLCMLIGRAVVSWMLAFLSSILALAVSIALVARTINGAVISYHIGGWAPPLGIEYRVDAANAFVLLIISAISVVVLPYAWTSVGKEIKRESHALFYACYLLVFTGLLGVTITGDAFNVFVFLEISSLSTYVLVAMGAERDKRALSVAYDYLVMGTIGATFFVIGLGFLYMATGTLNMVDISNRIAEQGTNRTILTAFAFIFVGMGLKLAIYPLHRWLPGAYTYAPSAISAFLAATATKVAIYVLMRFMFSVFRPQFPFEVETIYFIVLPFAVLAMFSASIVAAYQSDLKRLLAHSSIAQIGYILLGISFVTSAGVTASVAHLFNHALTKGALFMAVGAIVYQTGSPFLQRMSGLGRQMPWTSAAIVLGGLSLIGIPSTAGFISKWLLLEAALEKGWWPVAMLVVASSLIAVIYVWKIVEVLYLQAPPQQAPVSEAPLSLLVPTWILALACLYFGLDADFTVKMAETAAQSLIGGGFGADGATITGGEGR
ncbi:MAG: monovalent cation/H+ antiporter subunit D family protein [Pseudomonadota bacterium]